jgi:hypothetical protein
MSSEEQAGPASTEGPAPITPAPIAVVGDGMATALAMDRAGSDPKLTDDLRDYLREHRGYLQGQSAYLQIQRGVEGAPCYSRRGCSSTRRLAGVGCQARQRTGA